jgi:RelA/SpoT family (p)ppGpp synthetase
MLSNYYRKKLDELINICKGNLSSKKIDNNLISNAFKFALEAHKNEKRASGEPYFSHPYEVATIIAKEIPLDDISVASALLHDVVEDTKFTIKDIKEEFGDEIAEIVDGATKIEGISENYELKQVESYKKLLLSMTSDVRVMIVKFADRLHNLRTLEYLSKAKQYRLANETLEIFAPLAHRFGLSKVKDEMEDLSFKNLDYDSYTKIANEIKEKKREREKFIRKFIEPVKERLSKEKYKFEIYGRAKHIYSIYSKLQNKNITLDELYDLFAVRIILDTKNKNDCFAVYGICSEIYIPVPERFKNYISLPKQNAYQSIHTTLVSKEGKMVEVQIRTKDMHEIAEKGIAAHWKYKENTNINDKNLEYWMKTIRETLENVSREEYEVSKNLIESFKINLYQDEIYCFTPKGELKVLPSGATPIDFAFEIHTQVGYHCIGAKVNGKIVQLETKLKSGNQVEILTSKNQKPKKDWEKFIVTQKARADIKKYFNSEKRKAIAKGRELFEKKFKKFKINVNENLILKILHAKNYKDFNSFYFEISEKENSADDVIDILKDRHKLQQFELQILKNKELEDEQQKAETISKFLKESRKTNTEISIGKDGKATELKGLKYDFAKCCNPIPGDDVIGFVTHTEGVKIHRKNCKNIVNLFLQDPERIIEITWSDTGKGEFTGGIRIIGEDKPGILKEITNVISTNFKVNIRSINIHAKGAMFEGTMIISVENLKQLNDIIEKINAQSGIFSADRLDEYKI